MRRLFWIAFVLIGCSLQLSAQPSLDSLNFAIEQVPKREKVQELVAIGWHYRTDYPDISLIYLEKARDLVQDPHERLLFPKIYNFIGVAYWYKGDFFNAMEQYKKALLVAQKQEDSTEIAYSYHNIGRVHHTQTNFGVAHTYFFQALQLFTSLQDTTGMGYCYESLAKAYLLQEKYLKAIEMGEKSLALRKAKGNERAISSALIELADIYQWMEDYDRAIETLEEATEYAKALPEKSRMGQICLEMAETYFMINDYSNSIRYAEQAYNLLKMVNLPLRLQVMSLLGKLHYEQKNYQQAESYFQFILSTENKTGDLIIKQDAFLYLAQIKENTELLQEALSYWKRYNAVKDSIVNTEKSKAIGRLEGKFELLKKEQENNYLKKQEKISQDMIQQTRQRNLALVVIVILGAGFMGVLIWKNGQTRRLFMMLKQQKEATEVQYAQVKSSKEKLEELNEEKDGLMGIVAHDLKAPLNRIKGYVQIMKLTAKLDEEQQQYIEGIERSTENGRNLIRDLLDVSAFEQQDLTLHLEQVSLNELVEQLVQNYQLDVKRKDLNIIQKLEEGVGLYSDRQLIARIIENIFSNAIKFSPSEKHIFIHSWKAADHIGLSIRDEGPGFTEVDKNKMFKKFQQLSAKPTAGENSTGLGLAIVKSLIDRLQGEIQLISEPHKGATFHLKFPLSIGETRNS